METATTLSPRAASQAAAQIARKTSKPANSNRYVTAPDCPVGCQCEWCVAERETRAAMGWEALTAVEAEAKAKAANSIESAPVVSVTAKIAAPSPQMFVALPHNAQPGKGHRGSLPHWMPTKRTFCPCMMCSGIQEPTVRNGVAGTWCASCQFFTESEGAK